MDMQEDLSAMQGANGCVSAVDRKNVDACHGLHETMVNDESTLRQILQLSQAAAECAWWSLANGRYAARPTATWLIAIWQSALIHSDQMRCG
jgi:hypothetical protein